MIEKIIPPDFNGAVSIWRQGRPEFQKAYGFADLPNRIPNQLDTSFATASAGKAFVAVGVMKLIEEGRLSLDDRIGGLLHFDLAQIDPAITVRQLLNHTSGIPDYFDETVMQEYADLFRDYPNYKIRTSMDLLPFFIDKPMMYPKGERFQYNNTGYVVLGLVIESILGLPFDEYLDAAVFKPLSMHSTGYYELDRLPAGCANSYILDRQSGQFYTNIYSVDAKGTGAGGAFTSVLDVDRFWLGLVRPPGLLSGSTLSAMILPQTGDAQYGFGFWLMESGHGSLVPFFQGSDPGVSFISSCDIQAERIITLVSNLEQDVWELHKLIRADRAAR